MLLYGKSPELSSTFLKKVVLFWKMPQQRRIIYAGALPRFGRFCTPHRLYWKVQNLAEYQKEDAYGAGRISIL